MKKLGEAIGKFVVKYRILIVIASILLCIPSLLGYIQYRYQLWYSCLSTRRYWYDEKGKIY